MKRYLSYPKVNAELHGGAFLHEKYQSVITIENDGKVKLENQSLDDPGKLLSSYHGKVSSNEPNSWLEMVLEPDDSKVSKLMKLIDKERDSTNLVISALHRENELICSIYNEITRRHSSEIFLLEQE